jgi:hypothetical protein
MIIVIKDSRIKWIDQLRGLAIILMIIDHILAALDTVGFGGGLLTFTRMTITRPAMPLFMILSGFLWERKAPRLKRILAIALVSLAINLFLKISWSGYPLPEILLLWVLAAGFARVITFTPILTIIIGYTQALYWPISWSAYQPGVIIMFVAIGVLWGSSYNKEKSMKKIINKNVQIIKKENWITGTMLYPSAVLEIIGKYPLTWYTSHLVIIGLLVLLYIN